MKISLLAAALASTMLVGFASAQTYELNMSMVQNSDDPMMVGLLQMKERVEARTNGDLVITIFPSGQLGDTKDVMEQALAGANSAANTDAAYLAEYVPEIGIFGAPFVFDNYEQALALSKSDLFAEWTDRLRTEAKLVVLSFNWYQGARNLLTKSEVNTPADLAGKLIRTPQAPVWTEMMSGMGGTPTPMPWGEVYSALQTGVIDGAEAHTAGVYGMRFHETIPFIAKTEHIQLVTAFVAGDAWFTTLPPEYQKILLEEAEAGGIAASEALIAKEAEMAAAITSETGTVFVDVDRDLFRQAVIDYGMYEKVGLAETLAAVKSTLGQ